MIDKEKLKQMPKIFFYCVLMIIIWPVGAFLILRDKQIEKTLRIVEACCCFVLWIFFLLFMYNKSMDRGTELNEDLGVFVESSIEFETLKEEMQQAETGTDFMESYEAGDLIDLPDDFEILDKVQLNELPDMNELTNVEEEAVVSIGAETIEAVVYGNYESVSSVYINLDAYVITDLRQLIVRNQYFNDKWEVIYINDAENGKLYYPITSKEAFDYISGEMVVQKETEETENDTEGETESTENKTWYVNELEINGVPIVDSTINEMIAGYDYIKDISIEVDESGKEINIAVQISASTSVETAKMAGEDVARYLSAQASWATNSWRDYEAPGSNDLGSLYEEYNLLIYVDDSFGNFNLYGAKVTSAKKIIWR